MENGTASPLFKWMSHRIQPVLGAQGSTRKVAGSGTMIMSPAPPMPATPKPPSALNTGKTLRCAVSFASKVTVMAQPLSLAMRWLRSATQLGVERFQGVGSTDGVNLHASVPQILRIPRDAEPFRRPARKETVSHSLHQTAGKEALGYPFVTHGGTEPSLANQQS